MARRYKGRIRGPGKATLPTPAPSCLETPSSSPYPSYRPSKDPRHGCPSKNGLDDRSSKGGPDGPIDKISIGSLSLRDGGMVEAINTAKPKVDPFPFLWLPSELRSKVYEYHFEDIGPVIDLDPENRKRIHKKLALLRTCRTVYAEATYYIFSHHTFRLFPTLPGRPFKSKRPMLAHLSREQLACITSLELRLGPGWSDPPRGWVVNPALCLDECVNVRKLIVFVECDPSDLMFNGYRRADGFYEAFSQKLLNDVLDGLPCLDRIEYDAYPGVKKSGAMMKALFDVTSKRSHQICWGPERGWVDGYDDADVRQVKPAAEASMIREGVMVLA